MAFMSHLTHAKALSNQVDMLSEGAHSHRRRALHALFVHRDAGAIDACVQELQKAQFTVSADCVLNLPECVEQLRSRSYDVIIVEYPGSTSKGSQALQLLHQPLQEIALVFLMPWTWKRIDSGTDS
jgi:hypothetical protein